MTVKTAMPGNLEAREALTRRWLLKGGVALAAGLPLTSLALLPPTEVCPTRDPRRPCDRTNAEQALLRGIANGLNVKVPPNVRDPKLLPFIGQQWPLLPTDYLMWHKQFAFYADCARRGGSENWPMLCLAAVLLQGSRSEQAEADTQAIKWLSDQKETRGWMGKEIGSRVYWYMHVEPALIFLRHGSSALKAVTLEWLDLFVFWLTKAWCSDLNRVLWLGQRSAEPGMENRKLVDDLAAWVNNPATRFPTGNGNLPDEYILEEFEGEMRQAVQRQASNPHWTLVEPVTFFRGKDGSVAVYMAREVNCHTPPILGASTVGGTLRWAPNPPYPHIRENAGRATCDETQVEERSVLIYHDYHPIRPYATVTLPLPLTQDRFMLATGSVDAVL